MPKTKPTAARRSAQPKPEGAIVGNGPFHMTVKVELPAIVIPESDGGYSVIVPALGPVATCGDTLDEARANLIEAAEGYLESMHERGKGRALAEARGE
jgi:predicted RNase H-like HicB family nuclease